MNTITLVYIFCLFYVFIPGNIIKLPLKTTKLNLILIHGLLFSTILYNTIYMVEGINILKDIDNTSFLQKSVN